LLTGGQRQGSPLMDKFSIIFAGDNILLRKYLRMIVERDPNFYVTGEADDGFELLQQLSQNPPDVIVLESALPATIGLQTARLVRECHPGVKIVILAIPPDHGGFRQAREMGVEGYVLAHEIGQLDRILDHIMQGQNYVSTSFTKKT
jgi:DNA-binding NarL/FixJ family response regulator